MSSKKRRPRRATDPRRPGGSIAGPGGPQDRNSVSVDTGRAVLLDESMVAQVDIPGQGIVLGMWLGGRINQTAERAHILYLLNGDGAAALVTELVALATRIGPEFAAAFHDRLHALEQQGALGAHDTREN